MRALACLLALALASAGMTPHARAQAEDRGYGGPATVGPNFSTGKQSAPPDYGSGLPKKSKSASKPQPAKKTAKVAKPEKPAKKAAVKAARKPAPKPDADTASQVAETPPKSPDTPATNTPAPTPTSDASPAADTAATAAKPQTCRRFDATTSTTLEVPCN